ncbi:regulatory protein, gntR family [Arenibacter palladensis]|uniref:Regulatory protein, gntR family n=1 Tax=Arenibacter palladensis TaxID=237373 RepID=A0A1M5F122_9FLAO|nr:GntR family transcriptional regulator [Arenibacter palladensis]SHF85184.1 regulatory protein, gntR family [Arenibacter palladensis]
MNMLTDLKFDFNSKKPLYIRIADCFISNIANGNIKKNEQLPSINLFSKEYKVSRDTVEKAYKILKAKNLVITYKGKGTYIISTRLIQKHKVLFLFNRLNKYNLQMYYSFINNIGDQYHTDIDIYHCKESLFLNLIEKHIEKYDYYIIVLNIKIENPQQVSNSIESIKALKSIPQQKLIIIDNNELKIDGKIIQIFQDFENDTYYALKKGRENINKYKKLMLILPENSNYPYLLKITKGFKKFCIEQAINFEISSKPIEGVSINQGDLFIVIEDDDLVNLLDMTKASTLLLGIDVGIISFNDTPFKRLLGIAVISTNFTEMGETAASMIVNNKKGKRRNPFSFICRASV